MELQKESAELRPIGASQGRAAEYFGFASMLSELTESVEKFCRRINVEESAGRMIRGHINGALTSINDKLTEAIQSGDEDVNNPELDEASRHINSLIFWLSQMEFMSSQARDAAATFRIRCENLSSEIKMLAGRLGVENTCKDASGTEKRRDIHLRQLCEDRDFDGALLYIDAIVRLGAANRNTLLAGKYSGYRDRVLHMRETAN